MFPHLTLSQDKDTDLAISQQMELLRAENEHLNALLDERKREGVAEPDIDRDPAVMKANEDLRAHNRILDELLAQKEAEIKRLRQAVLDEQNSQVNGGVNADVTTARKLARVKRPINEHMTRATRQPDAVNADVHAESQAVIQQDTARAKPSPRRKADPGRLPEPHEIDSVSAIDMEAKRMKFRAEALARLQKKQTVQQLKKDDVKQQDVAQVCVCVVCVVCVCMCVCVYVCGVYV
jgi:hypothetical protein